MVAMAMDRCRHSPHFLEKPRSSINNSLWLLMSTDDLNPRIFGIIVEDSHFDEQSFGEFRDWDDGPVPARIVRFVLQFFGPLLRSLRESVPLENKVSQQGSNP